MLNPEWLTIFPNLKSSFLNRTISDHRPLIASSSDKNWGPKPFRFLNCWLSHPSYLNVIKKAWNSSENLPIPEKLKLVRTSLKKWNQTEFGIIDSKIAEYEDVIQCLDNLAQTKQLDEKELNERRNAQIELWEWLKRKESFWAQKFRAQWLKEGDKNTRFFHTIATIRKRKNSIVSITQNGHSLNEPTDIQKAASQFFKETFTEPHKNRPIFTNLNFSRLSQNQASTLITPFSDLEIDEVVASCASDKAPGPDGFNFRFIKNAWDIIKLDVYKIVKEFWSSSTLPRGSNIAFIALIPKNDAPQDFKDYRPISMVGSLYKIIAKLLARRLQSVIGSLISPFQSSFVKNRQILDGALIASELIESCKKRKTPTAILKLDFHKAFDSVSWNFLEWCLSQMGFPPSVEKMDYLLCVLSICVNPG